MDMAFFSTIDVRSKTCQANDPINSCLPRSGLPFNPRLFYSAGNERQRSLLFASIGPNFMKLQAVQTMLCRPLQSWSEAESKFFF
jgi:hypothetical protein